MAVPGRLQPHTHRPGQTVIELLGFSRCVHQLSFPRFPSFRIHPTNLLPTGMEITTYNNHLKAPFFPVVFVVKQRILCRTGPSLLSNQSFAFFAKGGIRCRVKCFSRIAGLTIQRRPSSCTIFWSRSLKAFRNDSVYRSLVDDCICCIT